MLAFCGQLGPAFGHVAAHAHVLAVIRAIWVRAVRDWPLINRLAAVVYFHLFDSS